MDNLPLHFRQLLLVSYCLQQSYIFARKVFSKLAPNIFYGVTLLCYSYSSTQAKSEGVARGQGLFTNSHRALAT